VIEVYGKRDREKKRKKRREKENERKGETEGSCMLNIRPNLVNKIGQKGSKIVLTMNQCLELSLHKGTVLSVLKNICDYALVFICLRDNVERMATSLDLPTDRNPLSSYSTALDIFQVQPVACIINLLRL
jgi:hypothetical protein